MALKSLCPLCALSVSAVVSLVFNSHSTANRNKRGRQVFRGSLTSGPQGDNFYIPTEILIPKERIVKELWRRVVIRASVALIAHKERLLVGTFG
jgi:hypothetical protein